MKSVTELTYETAAEAIADIRKEFGPVEIIAARWGEATARICVVDSCYDNMSNMDNGAQVATYAHKSASAAIDAYGPGVEYVVLSESYYSNEWLWDVEGPFTTPR